ncbi:general substrate transporter [Wolfiporia cocos MD-104 SS10]|uniref:General substrate transporter n=1 Tax=Wolfiporia cocos (strain MD-104) TaxID=742152 RepID=A0A2H3JSR8_WOLCO|nr:general substrate transporter [Wolfiporia cocos MD-104 SS10]
MGKGYNTALASNPYVVGSFACIGGSLFGMDISSMSGVLNNPSYAATFSSPSSTAQGGIVAAMPGGSTLGAIIASDLADRLGRRWTIITSACVWIVGCVVQCASVDVAMLVTGRVISGIAVGIASMIVPIYQSEVAPPTIRGRIVTLQLWAVTWGITIQYFVEFACSYIDGPASFRIPWGLQIIPAIILAAGMLLFPESPRWLADHDRFDEALAILADLHGRGDAQTPLVQLEYAEICAQVDAGHKEPKRGWLDLLAPGMARRVMLGCSVQMWSQLSGINVMMYYIVYVFEGAGLTGRRGNLTADSIQYVLNTALTFCATLYIDRWGRRPMLLLGTLLMGFWLMLVGGLQGRYGHWGTIEGVNGQIWVMTGHEYATRAVIACSYLFVCSFAATVGPVCWTYPAEIFPIRVRAKAVALAIATDWACNFALAFAVPPSLANIAYKTYFIFGTINFVAFIHIFFCFPETAKRSLEEIEEIFAQGHAYTAWRISKDVGFKNAEQTPVVETEKVSPEYVLEKELSFTHAYQPQTNSVSYVESMSLGDNA